jgi:hypothetical protein
MQSWRSPSQVGTTIVDRRAEPEIGTIGDEPDVAGGVLAH